MILEEQNVSTQLRGHHQVVRVMILKMAVHDFVLPFSISLLYQPDDGPLVGLKHFVLVKIF
jgi:hypothetical protein